jgi:hypothetical protein
VSRGAGAVAIGRRNGNSGPVRVGAVKALAVAPGIWNVRTDAVNPLERIERKLRGAEGLVSGLEDLVFGACDLSVPIRAITENRPPARP